MWSSPFLWLQSPQHPRTNARNTRRGVKKISREMNQQDQRDEATCKRKHVNQTVQIHKQPCPSCSTIQVDRVFLDSWWEVRIPCFRQSNTSRKNHVFPHVLALTHRMVTWQKEQFYPSIVGRAIWQPLRFSVVRFRSGVLDYVWKPESNFDGKIMKNEPGYISLSHAAELLFQKASVLISFGLYRVGVLKRFLPLT